MTVQHFSYSASDIADWFLTRAKTVNVPLKPMKIQKLVYFTYGWYYAYFDSPLFGETIYAFRHGPVVKELLDRFKRFQRHPITEEVTVYGFNVSGESLLDAIWRAYSHFSDMQLSAVTHTHTPWIEAYRSDEWFAVMSPESIYRYFQKLLKEESHASR